MIPRRGSLIPTLAALIVALVVPAEVFGQTPSPSPGADSPSVPAPEPSPTTVPLRLRRSATVEQDGVRLRVELERNPMPAGEPTWIHTTVRNVGKDDLLWSHDGCAISVGVGGQMVDGTWRLGEPAGKRDPTGLKWRASEWWGGADPTVRLYFWPAKYLGQGEISCSDVRITDTIPPGGVLRGRAMWDGMASYRLGPPPSGHARLTASFGGYKRRSQKGQPRSLSIELDVWVVDGRPDDMLHPVEVVDAALADPRFSNWIDGIRIGNRNTDVILYDPELDVWEVGIFRYGDDRFQVALVDPRSGEVLGIIDRPWDEEREPYP